MLELMNPPNRRATLDELAVLRDQGHAVELIDGEIVYKASPGFDHGAIQGEIFSALAPYRRPPGPGQPGGWWIGVEVDILYAQTTEVFRHDVSGWRREKLVARPSGMPVRVLPDWVTEVLSPSTARYDVAKKSATLHRHGVAHYWIVDPQHQTLTVLRHTPEGYLQALVAGVGDVVRAEPFADIEIAIADLFPRD